MQSFVRFFTLTSILFSSAIGAKVIYGEDNRIEVYQGTSFQRKLAEKAAVLIHKRNIELDVNRSQVVQITQRSLAEWLKNPMNSEKHRAKMLLTLSAQDALENEINFCSNVRFTDQPTAGECSGFLIGPDLVLTAGHCAKLEGFCSDYKWVFDYHLNEDTKSAGQDHPSQNIYSCNRVISGALHMSLGLDYALVQLDRKVVDRDPVEIRNDGIIDEKTNVLVIGAPSGVPLKIAPGARVRENHHPYFFQTNLDSFEGNSGSAVFNAATGVVEGILVRGEEDFNYFREGKCLENNVCADEGCRGEDVTRLTAIPEIGIQRALNKAAFHGSMNVLTALLSLDTWVDFNGKDGVTALMRASAGMQASAIDLLLENGANPDFQDVDGNSSLHHLSKKLKYKYSNALSRLLAGGADLELRNNLGDTPLLVAAKNFNFDGVRVLIQLGADPKAMNYAGETLKSFIFKTPYNSLSL